MVPVIQRTERIYLYVSLGCPIIIAQPRLGKLSETGEDWSDHIVDPVTEQGWKFLTKLGHPATGAGSPLQCHSS